MHRYPLNLSNPLFLINNVTVDSKIEFHLVSTIYRNWRKGSVVLNTLGLRIEPPKPNQELGLNLATINEIPVEKKKFK